MMDSEERAAAYKAAAGRSKDDIKVICDYWRKERVTPMDERGNTILHFLCMHGNTLALKKLLQNENHHDAAPPPTTEELRMINKRRDTPLHHAAMFGHKEAVSILLDKYGGGLVSARNCSGETPLYVAAAYGKDDVYDLLNRKVGSSDATMVLLGRNDGRTVLHAAILEENYHLALSIVETFPELADRHDETGTTAFDVLATKPASFHSGSSYCPRNLGSLPFIPLQILAILIYFCIQPMGSKMKRAHDVEDPPRNGFIFNPRRFYAKNLFSICAWTRGIVYAKEKHTFALLLAEWLIRRMTDWSPSEKIKDWRPSQDWESTNISTVRNRIKNPLIEATKNGTVELVKAILVKFPYAACNTDENGRNLLHIAVKQKDRVLYNYFQKKTFGIKDMLTQVDKKGNTVLHLAADIGTSTQVLLGSLNQMTWDVGWFKRVLYDTPPSCLHTLNVEGKTAQTVFKEKHSSLEKRSERELKDMNNGLMLVSALIGTVSYAALFTVPGGFDQNSGMPILLNKHLSHELKLFIYYVGLTLFSSLLALGTMLSIQLSRFRSRDFYMALPFRFLVAMTALFSSAIFTILACFQAYILETIPFHPNWVLLTSGIAMVIFYCDTIYLILTYMTIAVYYSFFEKGQEFLPLFI